MSQESTSQRSRKQVRTGVVVSDKMDKTAVIAVTNTVIHPLYRRRMTRTARVMAHDPANTCAVGDEVQIVASRPRSRHKRWLVRQVLKRAEES